ncbi:hypothetical protein JTB14_011745 [Gonioctena quinquepunctata]|nr:hypothetical protein JTB14_011745 [Gonioctena quinquepunctata]
MELDRKKKSVSFSVEEQLRLLDLINKEKNIIENKTTNKFTNDEKDKAWQRVTAAFNALALHRRNMDQLKSKYDNLKTKKRKVVAAQRTYIKGTGGGPPVTDKFDPVIENVLKIINIKTVVGFDSILDCDDDLDTGNEADDFSTTETGHTNYVEKQIPDLPILIIHDTNKESEPSESHTAEEIVSHCTQDNGLYTLQIEGTRYETVKANGNESCNIGKEAFYKRLTFLRSRFGQLKKKIEDRKKLT